MKRNFFKSKKAKMLIYYIIVCIFILCGFFVGSTNTMSKGGYVFSVYSFELENLTVNEYVTFNDIDGYRCFLEIGKFHQTKTIGWYNISFKISNKYFTGNKNNPDLELSYASLAECVPISDLQFLNDFYYGSVLTSNIVLFIIIIIALLSFPFIFLFITKLYKKSTLYKKRAEKKFFKIKKKLLKNLKELSDMKEQGIISEKEFVIKKKILVDKAKQTLIYYGKKEK